MDRRERDASWVKSFSVEAHGSITCWKPDGKDSNDLQKLTEEFVQFSLNWQGKRLWRRDYVCLEAGGWENCSLLLVSKTLKGQEWLQTSHDDVTSRKKSAVYTGALLDRLQ